METFHPEKKATVKEINRKEPAGRIHNQHGSVAVEFALIALLLLLVIFGIMEFGLYLFNRQIITNASREAARAGVVVRLPRLSNNQIAQVARNFCQNNLVSFGDNPQLTITIPPVGDDPVAIAAGSQRCLSFGCNLNVMVSYNYDFLVLSSFGIGPELITGMAQMRME